MNLTRQEREQIFKEETEKRAEEVRLKEEAHLKAANEALSEWAEKFGVAIIVQYKQEAIDKPSVGYPTIIITKPL